ncbi:Lrp/AsnC family transcriptional regulator [Kitasatospora sp. NBC_01266]|uniref:Lrp/AsnC family transcriptional regulator n=1 Tax=Kitasatospora sp. NBC_01266 TaxID=2903572 RepID=UPI002E2EB30A|nr:Lrp/AsnC family transcriptional regulator [Kitasatospora sp. NBC_01266]
MIDELDLALVDALRVEPRAPWSRLAGPLGVDPATLSRRWARLAAAGDAWVASYPSLGGAGYGVLAMVEVECLAGRVAAVAAELAGDPVAATVEVVSGRADLLLTVAGVSQQQLARYVLERVAVLPGVLRTRTTLVERLVREGSHWRDGALDAGQREAIAVRAEPVPSDAAGDLVRDRELLRVLGDDGRLPFAELAQRTGLPVSTVRRRLGQLRASGRLVLRCDTSSRLTGRPVSVRLWLEVPGAQLGPAVRWLAGLPQTRMCALTVGAGNLLVSLVVRQLGELRVLEERLAARAPGAVVRERQVPLRTVKLVGRLLEEGGRARGFVPIDPWFGAEVTPG